jgi:hypothetical protein
VLHAIAPAEALEQIVALRVHIDDSTIDNGPLRVLAGTHLAGVLNGAEIDQRASEIAAVDCLANAGGVIAMKPLLLHASSKARSEHSRRVIHIEYAPKKDIADGLELAITRLHSDSLSAFAGRWLANLEQSKRHPANLFQSASMDIEASGDTLTIVDRLVLESGDTHHGKNVMQVDGLEHSTDGLGNAIVATQIGARVIDVVGIHVAGDGGRLRYEVSEDGRTLTTSDDAGLMRVVFDCAESR